MVYCIFLGPFTYQGWERVGMDVDEEEEDLEADQDGEEEEEAGEEVCTITHIHDPDWLLAIVYQQWCHLLDKWTCS